MKVKHDGRLAPAYFLPNYIYFDQLLQTVKNKTTAFISISKSFYKQQFHHWILYFMQKGITILRWIIFVPQCQNIL